MPLDQRAFIIGQLMNMPLEQSMSFVYPKMYEISMLCNDPTSGTVVEQAGETTRAITANGKTQGKKCTPYAVLTAVLCTVEYTDVPRCLSLCSHSVLSLFSPGYVVMPPVVGLSAAHLTSNGAYLMDCGLTMFMWFGRAINPTVVQHLFGIPGLEGIDTSQLRLNPGGNDLCDRVNRMVAALR